MSTYVTSNVGLVRNRNEDDVEVLKKDDVVLLAVADGMGGHPSGHVASKMVIKCLQIAFDGFQKTWEKADAKKWLGNLFEHINDIVNTEAQNIPEYLGMGTTLVVALVHPTYILVANVGDSRAYITTEMGKLIQISEDHTLVAELYRQGGLSEEELAMHPNKNILLQAIGTEAQITVDIFDLEGGRPQKILLCTDGLSDMLGDEQIELELNASNDLQDIGMKLIALANAQGGKDNITVALWQTEGGAN